MLSTLQKSLAKAELSDPSVAAYTPTPLDQRHIPSLAVGLVFVHVKDGQLAVEELNVGVGSVPVQGATGAIYHLGVPRPKWESKINGKPKLLLYPTNIDAPPWVEDKMLANPKKLPVFLRDMESMTPCHTSEPNAFLVVTPKGIDASQKYKPEDLERVRKYRRGVMARIGGVPILVRKTNC